MILTVSEVKENVECGSMTDDSIRRRIASIEAVIRAYTNNKFQVRAVRFVGKTDGSSIFGNISNIREGDTIEISESGINDGLNTVVEVNDTYVVTDKILWPCEVMLVTKVEYPDDVKECAMDLFSWKTKNGDKVGLKSETISRHSVTFEDSSSLFMGYPTGVLSGLKLYKKVRC